VVPPARHTFFGKDEFNADISDHLARMEVIGVEGEGVWKREPGLLR
jgi:hypothetical protein